MVTTWLVLPSKSRLVTVIRVGTFTDIINNCDEKDKSSFWRSGCNVDFIRNNERQFHECVVRTYSM